MRIVLALIISIIIFLTGEWLSEKCSKPYYIGCIAGMIYIAIGVQILMY